MRSLNRNGRPNCARSGLWRACLLAIGILGASLAQAAAPTVAIAFGSGAIQSGTTTVLSITLGNGGNDGPATLSAALTDTLPAGLTIATPSGLGGSCTAAALTGTPGGRSVGYAAGGAIPAAGNCTIQVNVTGTSTTRNTYYTDSIPAGALQTNFGANATAASSTLTVHATPAVPNIVGLSQTAAAAALQAAGLTLGAVTHAASPAAVPYNSVSKQVPAAGAIVAAGSAVAVTISTGAGLATNPNRPLTSVPGFVAPYQQSEAAALERVCAALQSSDPTTLNTSQRNLLANCYAILGTYGGGVNAAGLKQTLNAISGMQTTAQERTGVQFSGAQFTNIGARLAQLRQGVSGASFSGLDLGTPAGGGLGQLFAALEDITGYKGSPILNGGTGGGASGARDPSAAAGGGSGDPASISAMTRLGFFVNGSLRRGSQDPTTYETPFDYKATNLTAGVDYRLTDRIVLGAAIGHSNSTTEFTDGSGRLDAHSNLVSLYATYYQQAFYVDLIGTFAHIGYNADRTTTFDINPNTPIAPTNCAGSQCSVDTTGSTGARQLAFATNVGYSFNVGGLTWGPDVAINYTHINVNGFTENDTNDSGLAMSFGDDIGESLLGKAGGHVSYAIKVPFGVVLPEARAHYVHEFKNDQRELSVHFSADPDAGSASGPVSNFVVFTDTPNRSYFDYAAGVSAQFAFGISAFIDYNAISSSDQRVREVAFGVRIEHQVP